MLKVLLVAVVLLLSLGAVVEAHDRSRDRWHARPQHDRQRPGIPIVVLEHEPIQGVGCYWARQTQFCSRYCYWQPDGRRYCVERERQSRREHVPTVPVIPYAIWPLK